MIAALVLAMIFTGLAGLIPAAGRDRSDWIGLRLSAAIALTDILLFTLSWLGGLALSTSVWIVAALAALGLARLVRDGRNAPLGLAVHPAVVLPALVLAVMAWHGPLTYLPSAWDEYANWLGWARGMVLDDKVWAPGMRGPVPGYSPGLSILMSMPSVVLGQYDDAHSVSLQLFMHAGLLGMVFDLSRLTLRQAGGGGREAAVGAWLVVLLALAVEATWKLLPPLQLIEKPQVYLIAAVAVLMVQAARADIHPWRLALTGGLLLAHAYLIKLGTQLLLPSMVILALPVLARNPGQRMALGLGLALPMAAAILAWKLAGIPDLSNWNAIVGPLIELESRLGARATYALAVTVALDYWPAVLAYMETFKPWLTLLSLGGFALAWKRSENRAAAVALVGFFALNMILVYAFHIKWSPYPELNSIDRFTRVPLRPIHLLGVVLGLLAVMEWGILRVGWTWRGRLGLPAAGLIVILLGVQAWQAEASLREMDRRTLDPRVKVIHDDALRLSALLLRRGQGGTGVQMIDQGQDGFARLIAEYFADGHDGRRTLSLFTLDPAYSWTVSSDSRWYKPVTTEALAGHLSRQTVLWPVIVDPWILSILAPMVDDPDCRRTPTAYFLFHRADGKFDCIAKTAVP